MLDINVNGQEINPKLSRAIVQNEIDTDGTVTGYRVHMFRSDTGTFTALIKEFDNQAAANTLVTDINSLLSDLSDISDTIGTQ